VYFVTASSNIHKLYLADRFCSDDSCSFDCCKVKLL